MKKLLYLILLLLVLSLGYVVGRMPRGETASRSIPPAEEDRRARERPAETTAKGEDAPSPVPPGLVPRPTPAEPAPRLASEPRPGEVSPQQSRKAPPVATISSQDGDDWMRQHDREMQRLADERRKVREGRIADLQKRIEEIHAELNSRFFRIVNRNELSEADIADQKAMEEELREAEDDLAEARSERR